MADGGWEHIRGAYIIQHLIEGAGWKRSRVEKKRKMHKGEFERRDQTEETEGLIEMGDTKWKRERGEGMESETTKGSGRERGMDGLREGKERKMLVYLNPSVASLNHGSPVILEIAHCNSPAPRF